MYDDFGANKKSGLLTFLKVALVVAILAFVAYKVYNKFFKKLKPAEADEADLPADEAADEFSLEEAE